METNNIIKTIRKSNKLTQTAFGKLLNCDRYRVADLERGKASPTLEDIKAISKHFNVSSDYLLGLTESQTTDKDKQYICDYIGLSEKAVEKLRTYCIYDEKKENSFDACDIELDKLSVEGTKKRINDFISSKTFDEFIMQMNRISYINDSFLSFLALCNKDYDMFSELYFINITKENISDCIIDFVYNYGNREIHNPFGNDMDLAIFKTQKSILKYFNQISYLEEIKDGDLQNKLDICLYLINSTLSKVKAEKINAYECIEEITNQSNFPALKNGEIRNLYEKLKAKKLEKS